MALDKPGLKSALEAAFQQGMDSPGWTLAQAAGAMADAIDSYVRAASVVGVTTTVANSGGTQIGTGTQNGSGSLQ